MSFDGARVPLNGSDEFAVADVTAVAGSDDLPARLRQGNATARDENRCQNANREAQPEALPQGLPVGLEAAQARQPGDEGNPDERTEIPGWKCASNQKRTQNRPPAGPHDR